MLLKENVSTEKLRGGYYTPSSLADFIVKWGFNNFNPETVLEPSCGDGVFLESLVQYKNRGAQCTAIEINSEEAAKAMRVVENTDNFNVINEDFYYCFENHLKHKRFDFIVGNPPYIRYQYLTEQQREEQSLILTSNGMKSNKLINAWVSFVVACVKLMSSHSKVGLVIPAELLQVAYSEDLRKFLMKELQRITVVTFRELVFPDVEQEVVILLGEKIREFNEVHQIRTVEYDNISHLLKSYNEDAPFMDVDPVNSKWTSYFLSAVDNAIIHKIKSDKRFIRFDQIADIDIGITTGNNKFFCADLETVEQYQLNDICRPLIARSVSIKGTFFDEDDWKYNINKGARAFLLDFPEIDYELYPEGFKRYIEEGEERGENKGYKCSIRERWYRVPSIWVPDAFFLRRNYLYPKFVLNRVNAVSTDTMHRIRFFEGVDPKRAVLAYYNSITLAFTEIEGRSYGGGVLEILPGEVEKITIPDLFNIKIEPSVVDSIVELVESHVRNNDDILGILPEIDKMVLEEILGIDNKIIVAFRNMWLKLRDRRLERGRKK